MGPASLEELTVTTGFEPGWVEEAVADLESDGMIESEDNTFRLSK
jgi:predicted transcriptional regulator